MKFSQTFAKVMIISTAFIYTEASQAFSLLEWLGWKQEEKVEKVEETKAAAEEKENNAEASAEAATEQNSIALGELKNELDIDELKLVFANLPVEKRREVLSDPAIFAELVKQQLALKSILRAIMANKLHDNIGSRFLMQRAAENTLREIYVNRLIAEKIPADFPNEEQIENFYKENQEKFTIGERVHLWQIFLPFENPEDIEAIKKQEKQAEAIISSIEKGNTEFAKAAEDNSKHLPSRYSGGYMGLVKTDDIIPAIRDRVMGLEEGKISKPIKTENGIHIVKRGAVVQAQALTLEQSRGQIQTALRQNITNQLRQAVVEQAQKTYPTEINDKKIEEWRLKLRTNM